MKTQRKPKGAELLTLPEMLEVARGTITLKEYLKRKKAGAK